MRQLRINDDMLTGPHRMSYKGRTLVLDTFNTLADPVEYFAEAMNTELEHGTVGAAVDTDVTRDEPLATARIVTAHLLGVESDSILLLDDGFPDYYDWLWWVEELHKRAMKRS